MSEDFDTLDDDADTLGSVILGLECKKLKMSVFLFIIFIIINSEVFIDRVMTDKAGIYASGRQVTANGIYVQALIIAISFIALDILIEKEYI